MINKSENLNELFAALAKAQSEMEIASMNALNPFFKSKYASFGDIIRATRPYLTKYGLCITQAISIEDGGNSVLVTTLGHSSGQFMQSAMKISPAKSDIQSFGSYVTYIKRYSYAAIVGVVAEEMDDDGEENYYRQGIRMTQDMINILNKELDGLVSLRKNLCAHFKIDSIDDLPKDKFDHILTLIRQRKQAVISSTN